MTQLETRETTVRPEPEPKKTEPVEPEGRPDLEGLPTQMESTELKEETDLPGVDLIPPDKISVFNSLRQQYTSSLNLLNESFSHYSVLPSVNPPEWEQMADKQGMIGAQLGGQRGQAPNLGSMGSETIRKKGGKGARANTVVSLTCPCP
ncbi:MAG: hypothetical protein GY696_24220 [Gammaproteobacteria bacterium]|nr:hypothetical protein [Gammaproteobacteria bacterium]